MMASADIEELSESEPLLVDRDTRPRHGYDQRKEIAGKFISGDHGTFLGLHIPNVSLEDSMDWQGMDNPISVALNICKERVLNPYHRMLQLVGWQRVFAEPEHCCERLVNWCHTSLVILLILVGYVIQYAACFRRDSAGGPYMEPDLDPDIHPPWSDFSTLQSSHNASSLQPPCHAFVLSQYIIPDIIHSVAYFYSFYLFRFAQTEQITTLTERVFLQTSPTQSGFQSQGRLIRTMRAILLIGIGWVIVSTIANLLHMVGEYGHLGFSFLQSESQFGKVALVILLAVSFFMLDIVYVAVTVNYCVQCALLIVYTESMQQKIREKALDLRQSLKEIAEIEDNLKCLNYTTALALSIVLFNFSTMAVLGTVIIMTPNNHLNAMSLASTCLSVICWFFILTMPIVQAARLNAGLNSLKKMGHELRPRPYVYKDTEAGDLDSFLLYTSSLNMRAKLFLVPVKTSYLCGFLVVLVFTMLLLFQTNTISIWIN